MRLIQAASKKPRAEHAPSVVSDGGQQKSLLAFLVRRKGDAGEHPAGRFADKYVAKRLVSVRLSSRSKVPSVL